MVSQKVDHRIVRLNLRCMLSFNFAVKLLKNTVIIHETRTVKSTELRWQLKNATRYAETKTGMAVLYRKRNGESGVFFLTNVDVYLSYGSLASAINYFDNMS